VQGLGVGVSGLSASVGMEWLLVGA